MKLTIDNKPVFKILYRKLGEKTAIQIYELRDRDDYCLTSRNTLEEIEQKKIEFENSGEPSWSNLKIVKIEIVFSEI